MILLILRKLLCYLKLAERAQETEINGALREVAAAELIEVAFELERLLILMVDALSADIRLISARLVRENNIVCALDKARIH